MGFRFKLFVLLAFIPALASAQQWDSESATRLERTSVQTSEKDNSNPLGWWPFISINMGLLDYDGQRSSGDGRNLQAKGLLSFYDLSGDYVFEGGAGVQNSEASDRTTTSAVLEASSRLRWMSRWEAGPLVNVFIGQGDRYGSSSSDLTSFVGGNLLYNVPLENNDLLRVGGRWVTDVGIPNEFTNIVMFEVHYGLPLGTTPQRRTASATRPRSDHLARLAFESAELNSSPLPYSTRQIEPNSTTKRRLSALAKELLRQDELVSQIRIIGHADERGSTYSNQMLSKARAQSVANTLIFAGYPKEKIEIVAMGENRPLVSQKSSNAWDANRRVEIEFKGVTDSDRLRAVLRQSGIEN